MDRQYHKTAHTIYNHRYHIVWITKYRYKVLTYEIKQRVRELVAQVSQEMRVRIINGVVSSEHLHLFCEIPVSDYVQREKGRTSKKIQEEYKSIRNRYWGQHLWARGYFSSTSGNVTDDVINEYINKHSDAHEPQNVSNISLE